MNDIKPVRALPTNTDVQTFRSDFDAALNYYTPQIADALPDDIPLHRFKRVLITAINQNRDLYYADRPSLGNACVKCAQDGLLPDGQEAALVVFNSEIKKKDDKGIEHSVWVPTVQYMPMIRGVRKRMRNSGEVLSAIAEVVYRNDKFRHVKGEDERIEHEPCSLIDDPGDPVGAYAIIKLANGEILRDVMSFKDIEKSRGQSRAKNSLMWTKFWGEGAKKTVLRRCAKGAPQDSRVNRMLARDDEPLELPDASHVPLPPPRPTREQFPEVPPATVSEPEPVYYDVTDCDAHKLQCNITAVADTLMSFFDEAQRRGPQAIEAAIENNEDTINELSKNGAHEIANQLLIEVAQLRGLVAQAKEQDPTPQILAQNPADRPPAPSAVVPPNADVLATPESASHSPATAPPPRAASYFVPPLLERDNETIAYRAWWLGRFLDSVRSSKVKADVPLFIAGNDRLIQGYFDTLSPAGVIAAKKELDDIMNGLPE